ncbi:hypothetical protein SDC9_181162 [bioreactor metagenome]|uniref:Uncharacterized protein n=1 Tax=bioreactor metagenome TaxID=1076179 RepID=A0A645H3Q6_9ZZZZ
MEHTPADSAESLVERVVHVYPQNWIQIQKLLLESMPNDHLGQFYVIGDNMAHACEASHSLDDLPAHHKVLPDGHREKWFWVTALHRKRHVEDRDEQTGRDQDLSPHGAHGFTGVPTYHVDTILVHRRPTIGEAVGGMMDVGISDEKDIAFGRFPQLFHRIHLSTPAIRQRLPLNSPDAVVQLGIP